MVTYELESSLTDGSDRQQRLIPTYTSALKSYPPRGNEGAYFSPRTIGEIGRRHARVHKFIVRSPGSMF